MIQPRDPDLQERMRQFEVVAKVAMQIPHRSVFNLPPNAGEIGLVELGMTEFSLSRNQSRICIGLARDLLAEVDKRDRNRNHSRSKLKCVA